MTKYHYKHYVLFTLLSLRTLGIPVRTQITEDMYIPEEPLSRTDYAKETKRTKLIYTDGNHYELLIFKDKVTAKGDLCVSLPIPKYVQILLHTLIHNPQFAEFRNTKLFHSAKNEHVISYLRAILENSKDKEVLKDIDIKRTHFFRSLKATIYGIKVEFDKTKIQNLTNLMRHDETTREKHYTPWSGVGRLTMGSVEEIKYPNLDTDLYNAFVNHYNDLVKLHETQLKGQFAVKKNLEPPFSLGRLSPTKPECVTEYHILLVIGRAYEEKNKYDFATINQRGRLYFATNEKLTVDPKQYSKVLLFYASHISKKRMRRLGVKKMYPGFFDLSKYPVELKKWSLECVPKESEKVQIQYGRYKSLRNIGLLDRQWDDLQEVFGYKEEKNKKKKLRKLKYFFKRCLHRNALYTQHRVLFPVLIFHPIYLRAKCENEDNDEWTFRQNNLITNEKKWTSKTYTFKETEAHRYIVGVSTFRERELLQNSLTYVNIGKIRVIGQIEKNKGRAADEEGEEGEDKLLTKIKTHSHHREFKHGVCQKEDNIYRTTVSYEHKPNNPHDTYIVNRELYDKKGGDSWINFIKAFANECI